MLAFTTTTTMQKSKIIFIRSITKVAPAFIITLASISTTYSRIIANDKCPAILQNGIASKQTSNQASTVNPPNSERIKQVAKKQNATLLQYSIITDEFTVNGKQETKDSELYIWAIKPTGEIAFRSVDLKPLWQKENTSLASLITRARESIDATTCNCIKGVIKVPILKEARNQKLQHLHQILIQPIVDILPTQANQHVIFIPQGELFLVPFAALQDANGKYLIEQHTISTAPSIQTLDLLAQQQKRSQQSEIAKDILIVGNPTTPRNFSQLPGAEQEAKQIAQIFNTQALTGNAATETAIVQRMPKARIIHLATHGCMDEQKGLENALILAPSNKDDGLLTAGEILDMKLNAELVVLSSNSTALGKITGDGASGLSRSFFAAGVPTVVGSLWTVDDTSTVLLMTKFYENLRENPDKASALRQAMLATMKQYPNPKDWAAFTLIGVS